MVDLAEVGIKRMNWMQLAEDMNQWRAFANTAFNL